MTATRCVSFLLFSNFYFFFLWNIFLFLEIYHFTNAPSRSIRIFLKIFTESMRICHKIDNLDFDQFLCFHRPLEVVLCVSISGASYTSAFVFFEPSSIDSNRLPLEHVRTETAWASVCVLPVFDILVHCVSSISHMPRPVAGHFHFRSPFVFFVLSFFLHPDLSLIVDGDNHFGFLYSAHPHIINRST